MAVYPAPPVAGAGNMFLARPAAVLVVRHVRVTGIGEVVIEPAEMLHRYPVRSTVTPQPVTGGGSNPMTTQTFVLPYLRASPVHIPRRDLVLAAADSLTLRITIVETDDPDAEVLTLTGGIGGPALQLIVWRDAPSYRWDYGGISAPGSYGDVLWQGAGRIASVVGSFDIALPPAAFAEWPRRAGFALVLTWDGQAETLALGTLHIRGMAPATEIGPDPIATDELVLITTD